MKERVYVGLSGGVDSAVSAALLQRAGYDVVGVFIKIWQPEFVECTWREDRLSAMRAAAHLGIPFREIDLSREYKQRVVDDMLAAYETGTTPNPDIACNEYIKFGAFFAWARREGAQYIATGHYARISERDGEYTLLRGVDTEKDQSYFLSRVGKDTLPHVLFPIGGYHKKEVRALAKRFGLPQAQRPDSQGLCFVGDVTMDELLSRFLQLRDGVVRKKDGAIIGTHRGAALYTIGQRHGLTTTEGGPWYVTRVDTTANEIWVSAEKGDCAHKEFVLRDVLWYGAPRASYMAQTRYRDEAYVCTLLSHTEKEQMRVVFSAPVIASPGQSVVGYDGEQLIWSGVVSEVCA